MLPKNFLFLFNFSLLILLFIPEDFQAQLLSFPGAEGYGRYSAGGRGGKVFRVTNLEDNGPGSLREAIESKGARIVVFAISGNIQLRSPLEIEDDSITIAGHTAPGDGICIQNFPLTLSANHIIIRYIRFRLGDSFKYQDDALNGINGNHNIIIDHCSASWGIDEVVSFWNVRNLTIQWCIISESLFSSIHKKGDHGYGGIWGGTDVSYHHNLIANHSSRTPRISGGVLTPARNLNFYNNVIYNWGFNNVYGGEDGTVNLINNYFKPGPATREKVYSQIAEPWSGIWYISGNYTSASTEVSDNNWMGVKEQNAALKSDSFLGELPENIDEPHTAYEKVLQYSGAVLPFRDMVDKRIIREVQSGSATFCGRGYSREFKIPYRRITGIIDSQKDVGGWPVLKSCKAPDDSDNDGIPDDWEKKHGLNPLNPGDSNSRPENGYTFIELYLNEIGIVNN